VEIQSVGIIGCGLMGSGIAQVAAASGFEIRVVEISDEFLEKGIGRIRKGLDRLVKKEKITSEDADAVLSRIQGGTSVADLAPCDLIIEAVTENLETKVAVFSQVREAARADAIIGSNTSSLSITRLMTEVEDPTRFLGFHFFNPVPVMKLVEVVKTLATSQETLDSAFEFARKLGKTPVLCEDRTGFLVNRLLIPYLLDAVRAWENGTGSKEDIDLAMKLGCGHPMGPFQLIDFIGLDTILHIAEIMYEEFKEARMAPPPTLKRLVMAGRLGRKSSAGFYEY